MDIKFSLLLLAPFICVSCTDPNRALQTATPAEAYIEHAAAPEYVFHESKQGAYHAEKLKALAGKVARVELINRPMYSPKPPVLVKSVSKPEQVAALSAMICAVPRWYSAERTDGLCASLSSMLKIDFIGADGAVLLTIPHVAPEHSSCYFEYEGDIISLPEYIVNHM